MKQTIQWHKECLVNVRAHARRQQEIAQEAKDDLQRTLDKIEMMESQIIAAEKAGKDGFDSEKFMQKRKSPNAPDQGQPT